MTLLTLAAYAETHGAKPQAATKWKRDGALVMKGDLVDVELSDEKMRGVGRGRFRVSAHGGRRKRGVRGVVDRPGIDEPPAPPPTEAESGFDALMAAARIAIEFSLGAQLERIAARLRKVLPIDAAELNDVAETILCWEIREEEETVGWIEWAEREADAIAADLGIAGRSKKVAEVLKRYVTERIEGDPMLRDVEQSREIVSKLQADRPR